MGAQITATRTAVAALAAALACAVAACSGDDSSPEPTPTATSIGSPTQSAHTPIVTGDADTPAPVDTGSGPTSGRSAPATASTTSPPEPSTVTVSYPEHIEATFTKVACNATLGQPGLYSVQAQSADGVTDNLVVIIKDGHLSQMTFSHAGKGWILPFDASGSEAPPAAVVDGTTLQIDNLHGKAAEIDKPSSTHDVDVSGSLTCTTGRLDDKQVTGGSATDNTLRLTGALDRSVTFSEVLCTPQDGGLIAVGQGDENDSDMITVTMTPSSTAVHVTLIEGAWQALDGSLDGALTRSGNAITISDATLTPGSSDTSGNLTLNGVMRCTAGSSE